MKVSVMQPYSLGIVAVNKKLNEKTIEVVLVEEFPFLDGEVTDNTESYKAKGSAGDGRAFDIDLDTTATVKAQWLPNGMSNRLTAPDVRRGERVRIWRTADEDRYYWEEIGDDQRLRKLETIILAFSATQKEDEDPSPDNSYFLEVSTHRKCVTFSTSKANEEPYAYALQFELGKGSFVLQDDIGNLISLISKTAHIEVINSKGTKAELIGKDIKTKAEGSTTHECPNTSISGNVKIGGNLTVGGNTEVGGNVKIGGNVNVGGVVVARDFIRG